MNSRTNKSTDKRQIIMIIWKMNRKWPMKRFHLKSTHKKTFFFSFAVRFFYSYIASVCAKCSMGNLSRLQPEKNLKKEQINKQNEEKMNKQRRITNEKYFSNIFLYQWWKAHTERNTFFRGMYVIFDWSYVLILTCSKNNESKGLTVDFFGSKYQLKADFFIGNRFLNQIYVELDCILSNLCSIVF